MIEKVLGIVKVGKWSFSIFCVKLDANCCAELADSSLGWFLPDKERPLLLYDTGEGYVEGHDCPNMDECHLDFAEGLVWLWRGLWIPSCAPMLLSQLEDNLLELLGWWLLAEVECTELNLVHLGKESKLKVVGSMLTIGVLMCWRALRSQ